MEAVFLQTANKNLLFGFLPDALGLLIFGIVLIVCATSLRWIFNRRETSKSEKFSAEVHSTVN